MNVIDRFSGEFDFLSNFYVCPFNWAGHQWMTSEHAYQACKTLDLDWRKAIRQAESPGKAKRMGQKVPMRDDWDEMKVGFMMSILAAKFSVPELQSKLIATLGSELVEGNTWGDRYWGVCDGQGLNWLGRCLMEIRDMHVKIMKS